MSLDLDAIEQRTNLATPGPWTVIVPTHGYPQRVANEAAVIVAQTHTSPEWPPTNAEFIAAARTDVPALIARIRELEAITTAVRELHWRSIGNPDACQECSVLADPQVVVWPCPTAIALGVTS